jgi:hypothetical protein
VKIPEQQKAPKAPKKALDMFSQKRGRGRPGRVNPGETKARGDNYRGIFNFVWDALYPLLSAAQTDQDIIRAFEQAASGYVREFMPTLASLVLHVIRARNFPKRRQPQINFMADSLAAYGGVSARRSRDICQRERLTEKKTHQIIRYEFWIECSCGYKGISRDRTCARCKAEVPFLFHAMLGHELA